MTPTQLTRNSKTIFLALCFLLLPELSMAAAAPRTILFLGDSITAGYGLDMEQAFPALIQKKIDAKSWNFRAINAGQSGDTSAGGLNRVEWLLKNRVDILVLELGGNDGLRGGDLGSTRDNLAAMVEATQRAGAKPLIVGMQLPPNYGGAYVRKFSALYSDVAKAHNTALVPFFFEGFGERNELFQGDRIHPTAAAQPLLLDNVWPKLRPLLGKPR